MARYFASTSKPDFLESKGSKSTKSKDGKFAKPTGRKFAKLARHKSSKRTGYESNKPTNNEFTKSTFKFFSKQMDDESQLNHRNNKRIELETMDDDDEEEEFDPYHGVPSVSEESLQKYERGKQMDFYGIRTKHHKKELIKRDMKFKKSVRDAARNELLLTEEAGYIEPDENEDTFRIKQEDIAAQADITSASKLFSLSLTEFGPYKINYSRDGRHLLLGGRRGHVAAMDWVTKRLLCEVNVMESVHDLCWLHMPTMFATAQKNWVYVYDNKGVELHCIKKMYRVLQMEFLPYHFLLVTSSEKGFLSWLDVSVGKMVKETYTTAGRLNIMRQNPYNAIIATGHPNGSVSMWSPNVDKPLAKVFCHAHPIRSLAIDSQGLYMATSSMDRSLKIFDVRTYKCLQSYKLGGPAGFLDFSQLGLLSVGMGNLVQVYKDCCKQAAKDPYLSHRITSTLSDLQFCPYEDVLGLGYNSGFQSILIPGAGQPNFDAFESNPFMTKSQRREMEVKSLLEKIQPELITLDPRLLGNIDVPGLEHKLEQRKSLLHVKPPTVEFEPRSSVKGSKRASSFKQRQIVKETEKRDIKRASLHSKQDSKTKKDFTNEDPVFGRFKRKVN